MPQPDSGAANGAREDKRTELLLPSNERSVRHGYEKHTGHISIRSKRVTLASHISCSVSHPDGGDAGCIDGGPHRAQHRLLVPLVQKTGQLIQQQHGGRLQAR